MARVLVYACVEPPRPPRRPQKENHLFFAVMLPRWSIQRNRVYRGGRGEEQPPSSRLQTAQERKNGTRPCGGSGDGDAPEKLQQRRRRRHLRGPNQMLHQHLNRCCRRSSNSGNNGSAISLPVLVISSLLILVAVTRVPKAVDAKVTPNGGMAWDGNGWLALVDDDSDHVPPPPKSDSWKRRDTTMFVGVSSFRDKRCPQTLLNFFTKAKHPERLTVAVVQQNDHEDVDCVTEYCSLMGQKEGPLCPFFDNIKTLRVEAKHAAGPCYGRHLQVERMPCS